ncbi:YhcN/YlaJ family sporulation lipoprotein [Paenibacillus thailandensis]|uniref:YhcN/YlaJ family sporulation lipoprotein n=1 Tax=Paenibacillus thailandensis TaxID=393250 RepID=A0ABW5QXL0_9BACL
MLKRTAAIVAALLILSGCGTVARNETSPSPRQNNNIRTQQTEPRATHIADPREVAAHLEQLAASVPGVNSANAVVLGNTAVVGINVDPKLDRSRVGTIKYSVAEAFHKDPYGIDALVTADMDLAERIRELSADVQQGRPATGLAEELADIVGRIIPQAPRDVMPRDEEQNAQQQMQQQAPNDARQSR